MPDRGASCIVRMDRRNEDELCSVLLVPDVSFRLQTCEMRAHAGITGRIRQTLHYLLGGCPSFSVKNVDDLPFSSAQRGLGSHNAVKLAFRSKRLQEQNAGFPAF